jgi:hypothetical protein
MGLSASDWRRRRSKAKPSLDDLAILWQMAQAKPEMTCELNHRLVLREDFAYDLAHAVQRRPIKETLHQMRGEPPALQVVLHDHGKLGHKRIVFADELRHPHGLASSLPNRDESHVAVVVEPGELIELRGCEFTRGCEETQPNILGRETVEEGVVLCRITRADRTDQEPFAAGVPAFVRFRGIPRYATSL